MPVPNKIPACNTFGEALFNMRRKRRMQQKQLAIATGLDQSYLASLERGRRAPPRTPIIERIISGLQANQDEEVCLTQAAVIGRAERLFSEQFADLPQALTIVRVLSALPLLGARELEAIETFAEGFIQRRGEVIRM